MQATNFTFRNELKSVKLQFGKNTDGFYVAGVKKPNDFVNGYCEIDYLRKLFSYNLVNI